MSYCELLTLVQLTKEYIFGEKEPPKTLLPPPIKPQPQVKPAMKIAAEPAMKIAAEPTLQKKAPVQYKAPLEVKSGPKPQERDVNDILGLLRVHCPLLKLINPPQNKILMLFDSEPQEEKQILINMANALKKEGGSVEMIPLSEYNPNDVSSYGLLIAERSLLLKNPLFKEIAKRDAKGNLFFGQTKALVIPSLAELIAKPFLRRELWNQILMLIQ